MTYRLCVTIVLFYNLFIADTYELNPLISKSINITTIIGETIEFNCSEYMGLQKHITLVFKWYKDGKSLRKVGGYNRMSLVNKNEILKITNITIIDNGTYECAASNQFQSEYSIYTLIVNDLPKRKTDKKITSYETIHIGDSVTWSCSVLYGKDKIINQYIWLKNEKLLRVEKSGGKMLVGERNKSLKLTNVTYTDKGTYECLAINNFQIDSSKYVLDVVELPNKTFYNYFNRHSTLHINESIRWRCLLSEIQNRSNFRYTWLKNDEPLRLSVDDSNIRLQEKNFVLAFKNIKFDNAGTYRCVASNEYVTGYVNRTLSVVGYPEVMIYRWFVSNIRLMVGATVKLKCNTLDSTKNYPTKFSWKENGKPLVFSYHNKNMYLRYEKSKILILLNITSNEKVTYECEAKNYYHKMYSVYTLNIIDQISPEIYNSSNSTTSVKLGESVQLFCYSKGMPPPMISWFKNGNPFHTSENNGRVSLLELKQKLRFVYTISEDNGTYKCNVSNQLGSKVAFYILNVKRVNASSMDHDGQIFTSLIFVILFLSLGIFILFYIISFKREQILKKKSENTYLRFESIDVEKLNPDLSFEKLVELLHYNKEWEYPRNKLTLGKQLGSGVFGDVFKANAIGITDRSVTSTVIVKKVKPNSETCNTKALISELKIMIHVGKHVNIVNLLGACTGENNKLMVIIEYCRYGSIEKCLLKQRDCFVNQITPDGFLNYDIKRTSDNVNHENDLDNGISLETHKIDNLQTNTESYFIKVNPAWCSDYCGNDDNIDVQPLCTYDLICWSFQVARGMEYLASRNVFHGDLATRNILLADDNVVKISDFGLPKNRYNTKILRENTKNVPLPVKWMAIESFRDQIFSIKSDVWSFGIVLWEIFSLAITPYPNIKSYNDLLDLLENGYRMEKPKYASSQLYNIMLDCWKIDPTTRPLFNDLVRRLGDLLSNDSKLHYKNLNEDYVRMNMNRSLITDHINLFKRPILMNCPNLSKECDLQMKNDKKLQNKELRLKRVVHNN